MMAHSPNSASLKSADLHSLLRINKGFPVLVTYKGNDAAVYQHALSTFFAQNATTWKRHGKYFPYPLSFPLKFIPYEDRLVFTVDSSIEELKQFAFVHVFFITSSSAEEYRTTVRHTVSEWFAGLSLRPELQWLIVVDSTRAKEKKNRTNLMEKIKQDFSKHLNKVIEVSESIEHGSFTTLTAAMQSSLFSHLDLLTETWERCLKAGRERYVADDWNLLECVNQELEYARLFWSLGALDHALKLYEDLDSFIIFLIASLSQDSSTHPAWVYKVSARDIESCPSLFHNMREEVISAREGNIAGVRHMILSHKLLLTLALYHTRLAKGAHNPSARCDYAAVILKYSFNTIQGVIGHAAVLGCHLNASHLSIWCIQLMNESFSLSSLISDISTVDSAIDAACAMYVQRIEGLLQLADLNEEEKSNVLEWMEGQLKEREMKTRTTNTRLDVECFLSHMTECLRSPSTMESTMIRWHDSASSFLVQAGRRRTAALLGHKFANFLTARNKSAAALPYALRFVTCLVESGDSSDVLLSSMRDALKRLHPIEDFQRIVAFRLFLAQKELDEDKRREEGVELLKELQRGNEGKRQQMILPDFRSCGGCPIRVRMEQEYKGAKYAPGDKCSPVLFITSLLPVSLPSSSLRVSLRRLSSSLLDSSPIPAFDVDLRSDESRVVCVHKGSHSTSSPTEDSPPVDVTLTNQGEFILEGGKETRITVEAVTKETGIFILDRVEMSICSSSLTLSLSPSLIVCSPSPFLVIVESVSHSIQVLNKEPLEAGVSGWIELNVKGGSSSMDASRLRVSTEEEGRLEFMSEDGLWESLVELEMDQMRRDEERRMRVRVCLPLEGELKEETIQTKIRFDWEGICHSHILSFIPLFTTRFSTSHLENKMLVDLELSMSRPTPWVILPQEASLHVKSDHPLDVTTVYFGKEPVSTGGVHSLVWFLSPSHNTPPQLPFNLKFNYRVRTSQEEEDDERVYEYTMNGDMQMKNVEYEVCSQVLSQQPGAQLCRVGTSCHLLVSIRSLFHSQSIDSLVVSVVVDDRLWEVPERTKSFTLKESGLGQVSVVVIPLVAGFLPFPSVQLFPAASSLRSEDRFWSEPSEFSMGAPLFSFERTAGRQIRVLGASTGEGSVSSKGEKRTIKEKLQKLFD